MSDERFDLPWLVKAGASYLGVSVAYGAIGLAFGWTVSLVCGLITLAYCLGVFYGAGSEIMKREREG